MVNISNGMQKFLNNNIYFSFIRQLKIVRSTITKIAFTYLIPKANQLFITYFAEASELQDGIGAQLHRIFGILGISKSLKIGYIHTPIKDFTTTQLDPAQKRKERISYCIKIDKIFTQYPKLKSLRALNFQEITIDRLTIKILIKYIYLSKLKNTNYLLKVKLPFPLIDTFPNWYKDISSELMVNKFGGKNKVLNKKVIAVHFRNGIKSNHIETIGMKNRWLSDDYFTNIIENILESYKLQIGTNAELKIYTDSPIKRLKYHPPKEQIHRYLKSGYKIKENSLYVEPFDFKASSFSNYPTLEIIHGGDALEAIIEMKAADYFIMSRSSMSYCAAVLNTRGNIYYPPNFWHAPMPNWIRVKI